MSGSSAEMGIIVERAHFVGPCGCVTVGSTLGNSESPGRHLLYVHRSILDKMVHGRRESEIFRACLTA